jgi:hypothetical protein
MSEDWKLLNTRGRHAEYKTVELNPVDDDLLSNADDDLLSNPVDDDLLSSADDVDLSSDPFADDLSAELAARAPRRYATRTTAVLAGLVLVAGGFFAGAQVQKNYGTPANGSAGSRGGASNVAGGNLAGGNFSGRQGGGQNGGQNPGTAQPSAGAGVTTGTVKLVDGTTVYVQTPDGNVLSVRTNGSTAVRVTQSGALTDLTPGTQVSVEGPASSDGTVTATKVTKGK